MNCHFRQDPSASSDSLSASFVVLSSITMKQHTFSVKPVPKEGGKKINFGAVVEGLDLNNVSGRFSNPLRTVDTVQ